MAIELGGYPWILIGIMFLELLFIFIPALIASKIENTSIHEELKFMGFQKNEDSLLNNIMKVLAGVSIGFILFLIGGYVIFIFKNIVVKNIFGNAFVKKAEEGTINTTPIAPNLFQLIIIIIMHILFVSVCEEAFFRGFIIKKFERKIKTGVAILFSSIFFAFYHIPPILVPVSTIVTYFGYYFIFGVILSSLFKIFNNSLIPCVIAHGLFNILILIF